MLKNVKGGTLLDLLAYILLQNIKKLEGGTLWGHLKKIRKKSHTVPKKIQRGDFRKGVSVEGTFRKGGSVGGF